LLHEVPIHAGQARVSAPLGAEAQVSAPLGAEAPVSVHFHVVAVALVPPDAEV